MTDFNSLSDLELRAKLQQYGLADVPITKTTRDLVVKRLKAAIESGSNGYSEEHVEPVSETRHTNSRRRSMAAPSKPKAKSKQRASLAGPISPSKNDLSDESDGHVKETGTKRLTSLNSSQREMTNGKDDSVSTPGNMTDGELIKQLTMFHIPVPAITSSTRPLLIKKLNHAMAKQRRESKAFSPRVQTHREPEPEESNHDTDTDNETPSFVSVSEKPSFTTPSFAVSPQHSFTLNNSSIFKNESSFIAKYLEYQKPILPSAGTVGGSPSPSFNGSTIVNRFVEEQEPYDTCSDSDTDAPPVKMSPKKKWSMWNLFSKFTHLPLGKTTSLKPSFLVKLKNKLSILWHWQFITIVLPLSALLFFVFLAAFYIRASYTETGTNLIQPPSEYDQTLQLVKEFIEKDMVSKLCSSEEAQPLNRASLIQELHLNDTTIDRIQKMVESNSQWGIAVEEDLWSVKTAKIPFWCWIRTLVWKVVFSLLVIFAVGTGAYYIVTLSRRQREREEQEVYALVEKIIDLLARHQAAMVAEKRPQEAFLAVTHVRDVLIPLKERKLKMKLWGKAVQFLEDNESRVRPEIQQIEGEDFRVWRWLPPSCAFGSPTSVQTVDQTDEGAAPAGDTGSASPRPKVWQGQAFSTDSSGVNSPPPYPLTQCLKVRNMFDAEVEVGESWPVRIQDAILEKADQGKIIHMAVDRGSREGCVYIKCSSAEEAGKVYRALHGWWFDGNLVTVKYLRPERYHYRFPDSAKATIPLQPSNDKRLSLPTKFWKSPLEHF